MPIKRPSVLLLRTEDDPPFARDLVVAAILAVLLTALCAWWG